MRFAAAAIIPHFQYNTHSKMMRATKKGGGGGTENAPCAQV